MARLLRFGRYSRYARSIVWRYVIPLQVKRIGVLAAKSVHFQGMPIISLAQNSAINIGENCVLCSEAEMTALGVNHPVILRTLQPGAIISIGKNTGISGGTICAALNVVIGNECLIGANVIIADTDFHPIKAERRRHNSNWKNIASRPVVIEDNVFIGTGAIILKGVTIGKNSVIGAGSVVTNNVPPNSVVAGNPAKILRSL